MPLVATFEGFILFIREIQKLQNQNRWLRSY